jgi:hypothetical protein
VLAPKAFGLELLRSDHREDEIDNEKHRDYADDDVFHTVCLDLLACFNEKQEDPEGDDGN